ncbi:MAG: hypothetical protein ACPHLK_08750 [Gammaproteobacteria bacterium]
MMNSFDNESEIEIKTIGDSRGYLWKIIMDKKRGIGKIEKVSGLNDNKLVNQQSIDGSTHALETDTVVSDDMQKLTSIIESRFQAA